MLHRRSSLQGRLVSLGALSALGLLLGAAPAQAAVTLATEAAADFDATVQAEGLQQPVDVAVLPDGKVLVITRTGDVLIYSEPNGEPTEQHIDVDSGPAEQGLLGVVLDPGFATNQFIYFYASLGEQSENRHHVVRYKLGADGMLSMPTPVITMGLRGPANHNGGAIDIHDGNLYIGVGDTGANATPPQNKFGSCLNIANGKVLRVSLAEATLGQPAAGNPLENEAMVTGCTSTGGDLGMQAPDKRIFAWGFRNPFRLWVDPSSGKVWVGDVGEEAREEISIVEAGKHYGYPFEEGTVVYDQDFKPANGCMGLTPASECIKPVHDWARAGGGTSIGGRILDGCGWPDAWKSRYIFGDYVQDDIWTLEVNAGRDGIVANSLQDFASADGPVAFRMGTDNALYIAESASGTVTRITPKGMAPAPNSCPDVNDPPGSNPGGGSGAGGGASGGNAATAGNSSGGNGSGGTMSGVGMSGTGGTTSGNTSGNSSGGSGNPATGGSSGDSGGCGCRTVGHAGSLTLGFGALAGALGLSLLRRRRGRRS